jgi:hypothetical protein
MGSSGRYTIPGALHLLTCGRLSKNASVMIPKLATFVFALAIASAGLTSCNKTSLNFSGTTRTDWTVNDHRTVTKTVNGLTRKLDATTDVKMEKGKITSFPKGALVKLDESGSATPRVAELRENGGSLELWVKESGTFRRGTTEEEVWLVEFLKDVIGE